MTDETEIPAPIPVAGLSTPSSEQIEEAVATIRGLLGNQMINPYVPETYRERQSQPLMANAEPFVGLDYASLERRMLAEVRLDDYIHEDNVEPVEPPVEGPSPFPWNVVTFYGGDDAPLYYEVHGADGIDALDTPFIERDLVNANIVVAASEMFALLVRHATFMNDDGRYNSTGSSAEILACRVEMINLVKRLNGSFIQEAEAEPTQPLRTLTGKRALDLS